jgi:hypothetical protein
MLQTCHYQRITTLQQLDYVGIFAFSTVRSIGLGIAGHEIAQYAMQVIILKR